MSAPLYGVRIVVTRAVHQAQQLESMLAMQGAQVELLPLLKVLPPQDPTPLARVQKDLESFHWVLFTSTNTVRALLGQSPDPPPRQLRIAAVGNVTRRSLEKRGWEPHVLPDVQHAEGLAAALLPHILPQQRVLLPQATDARPILRQTLEAAGIDTTTVIAYRKEIPPEAHRQAHRIFGTGPLGWVTFTSPRIVRSFVEIWADHWEKRRASVKAASIGPVTSEALRHYGVECIAEAKQPQDAALVAVIVAATANPR